MTENPLLGKPEKLSLVMDLGRNRLRVHRKPEPPYEQDQRMKGNPA